MGVAGIFHPVDACVKALPILETEPPITLRMTSAALPDRRRALDVLVADEDADTRRTLELLLAPLGTVRCVERPPAALAAIEARLPDLVICSCGRASLDLLRHLQQAPRTCELPVVLVAGEADVEETSDALREGAADVLPRAALKPDLLPRLRVLLEARRELARRRRAEERAEEAAARFRQLADAMPQMVWTARPDGSLEYINRRFQDFTGLPPGDPPPDPWPLLAHPEDAGRLRAGWELSLETGHDLELECRLRRKDGSWRWHLTRAVPVRGVEASVERWFGTCTDIEEQKKTERALRDALRLKDEFVGLVSHELRTPLNAILSWAWVLEAQGAPALGRALAAIRRNAEAQRQLVEELLDVSRVASGSLRIELAPLALAEVVDSALQSVRAAAEARTLRLEVDLDRGVTVWGDERRLRTVAWHLLSNAVKFTPPGGTVTVRLARSRDAAELRVSDTGIGIDAGFLPHVFERFRQADASSTRAYGGLGLGLALARSLVEAHGGEVEAASEGRGLGSTFTVRLPVATAVPREVRRPATAAPERRLQGVRVLVVDDHPDSRDGLAAQLTSQGAEVATASNARETLAWLVDHTADVLLLDLRMPGEDGVSLLGAVRRLGPDRGGMPAVAVSSFAEPADRQATLRAGFRAHLAKPVDVEELVSELSTLVRRH
jgi:PAS domain S-box-containing protein